MRLRFVFYILFVLTVVALCSIQLHSYLLKRQQIAAVDQQVRETAATLLTSELNGLRDFDFVRIENIISEELGENRIGKFFVIRDQKGEVLFESTGAQVLPIPEVPRHPKWFTYEGKGQYIRVLNLDLPRIENRTLQVGLVLSEDFLSLQLFSWSNLFFGLFIISIGLLLSWALTARLMRPIRHLSEKVIANSELALRGRALHPLEGMYAGAARSGNRDEFRQLIQGLNILIERVNQAYRLSRVWSYQMAHELKTPLTLLNSLIEKSESSGDLGRPLANQMKEEIFSASGTISSFLAWAEIEHAESGNESHILHISRVLSGLEKRLQARFGSRLRIEVPRDFTLLTNPAYLEAVLMNLMTNALQYSDREVTVKALNGSVEIGDLGPGIPQSVLDRLGDPFNRGAPDSSSRSSHGIGLAIVHSAARTLGWKLEINSEKATGTRIVVSFPEGVLVPESEISET